LRSVQKGNKKNLNKKKDTKAYGKGKEFFQCGGGPRGGKKQTTLNAGTQGWKKNLQVEPKKGGESKVGEGKDAQKRSTSKRREIFQDTDSPEKKNGLRKEWGGGKIDRKIERKTQGRVRNRDCSGAEKELGGTRFLGGAKRKGERGLREKWRRAAPENEPIP